MRGRTECAEESCRAKDERLHRDAENNSNFFPLSSLILKNGDESSASESGTGGGHSKK